MINGICLKNALMSGANNLSKNKKMVDDLNIFPVPDGDTGTNMSMTISAAVKEIENLEEPSIGEIAKKIASSLLRGARGNSGVILSILFKGFAQGLSGMDTADGASIISALEIGVDSAYKAVMKPTEGTMLTVARVAYETGKEAAVINNDPIFVWDAICEGAEKALESTPELLPVLKKAGVVDAGGKGVCLIFEGMMSVFKDGKIISNDISENAELDDVAEMSEFRSAVAEFDGDINFTYCTELIIGRNSECKKVPKELREYLEQIGDCVVVVDDEEIIKVHVHTETPGLVLQKALDFGQLLNVKVENMKEQHKLAKKKSEKKNKKPLKKEYPEDDVGFVAVAAGEGVEALFKDLGCLHVVTGGQTMNPSTEDIQEAILATPAKVVYVFPNNKNIILAAEQAVPLIEDRKVVVIPTKTIPQGISAMLAYDPELSANENTILLSESFEKVDTGLVTFASRDSEFGGFKIKENDILALENGKLKFTCKNYTKALSKLVSSMSNRHTSFITLIYGEDISEDEAEDALEAVRAKVSSHIDVTLINGGQPIYYFIVSVE